jgi:hypothetical protein
MALNVSAGVEKLLLGLVGLGGCGLLAELLLLGHFDQPAQWIPLAVLALLLGATAWQAVGPSTASRRSLRFAAWLATGAGVLGTGLHLRGNALFEQEMNAALAGWPLVKAALLGGVPALAPGALAHLGLLALVTAWRVAASALPSPPTGSR